MSFYCRTAASTTHCKHTFDALFTQDLFRTQANCFTRTLAVGDSVSGTVFKTRETRKGKRGRERTGQGKKEKGNLNWSLVNLQTFFQGAYMV